MLVMPRNLGEENEIFLKTFLLMMFLKKKPLTGPHNIGTIESLSFSPDGVIPEWKDDYVIMLKNRDYESLKKIFPKAPTGSKADLEINGIKYSAKNSLGAKSAIVNHTSRKGFLRVFDLLNMDISTLDKMIQDYWIKRNSGIITEDISNSSVNSPFSKYKDYLKPVIEYFLFRGTGSKDSVFQADKMFIFNEPEDMDSYKILNQSETVDLLWDSLVFSLRSKKGMPTKKVNGELINTYSEDDYPELKPWIGYIESSEYPKGALHIRT